MANPYILISFIVIMLLLILVNGYLLAYYCHPDDKGWGASLYCKLLVIVGLTVSWAMVLLLPLDVANSRGYGGGLPMVGIWYVVIVTVAVLAFVLIPFSIFYYETDEDKTMTERICGAAQMSFCTFAVCMITIFILYISFSKADIPVTACSRSITTATSSTSSLSTATGAQQVCNDIELALDVSFVVFLMACITFFGMFLFVLFGGVGLFGLPLGFIHSFTRRPQVRNAKELRDIKKDLKRQTEDLQALATDVQQQKSDVESVTGFWAKRREKSKEKKLSKKLRKKFAVLRRHYELFKFESDLSKSNPLWYVTFCAVGVIFLFLAFMWWIHINIHLQPKRLLFMVWRDSNGYPLHTFLNRFFIKLGNSYFDFLGIAAFGGMGLYLIWSVIKGNIQFGLRFAFFTFHPMKKNATWMNSFLFNVQMILISSCAVTQFCSRAFSQYTRLSTADLIFGQQINYLRCFKWFFKNNIFDYVILIWSLLTFLYLVFRPHEFDLKKAQNKERERQMELGEL